MTAPDRTLQTERRYAIRARQIRSQAARELGLADPDDLPAEALVRCLIERKSQIAKSTWRQYKAVLVWDLHRLAERADSEAKRQYFADMARWLASQPQTGARRRGTRSSARKSKGCERGDLARIVRYLREHIGSHRHAEPLALMLGATLVTGLRPSEWEHANLQDDPGGRLHLVVKNAKHGGWRGNGMTRTIDLAGTGTNAAGVVRSFLKCLPKDGPYGPWQSRLARYMTRVAREALGKRERYPSIYSLRHQFAADCKASGLDLSEIAALMGHATDATASLHYGRRSRGRRGVGVRAAEAEVAVVRRKFRPFPAHRRKAAPT